eukprot:6805098-Pyramimonas_sp.AAC.1
MTNEGRESLSAELATDGARAIPNQAFRDLGRELVGASGDARARIEALAWDGAPDAQEEKL